MNRVWRTSRVWRCAYVRADTLANEVSDNEWSVLSAHIVPLDNRFYFVKNSNRLILLMNTGVWVCVWMSGMKCTEKYQHKCNSFAISSIIINIYFCFVSFSVVVVVERKWNEMYWTPTLSLSLSFHVSWNWVIRFAAVSATSKYTFIYSFSCRHSSFRHSRFIGELWWNVAKSFISNNTRLSAADTDRKERNPNQTHPTSTRWPLLECNNNDETNHLPTNERTKKESFRWAIGVPCTTY